MVTADTHDYIARYEAARERLADAPGDRRAQYDAVLNLARAGSTYAAISLYQDYGLGEIADDEDILALRARLSKDLYLQNKGQTARTFLEDAARGYANAFEKTGGYFSGINAATLAYLSDSEAPKTRDLIAEVGERLFYASENQPEEQYFLKASQAEIKLLQGEPATAKALLTDAIAFDPLNYSAHGTTF